MANTKLSVSAIPTVRRKDRGMGVDAITWYYKYSEYMEAPS